MSNSEIKSYREYEKNVISQAVSNYDKYYEAKRIEVKEYCERKIQEEIDSTVIKTLFGLKRRKPTREEIVNKYKSRYGGIAYNLNIKDIYRGHNDDTKEINYFNDVIVELFMVSTKDYTDTYRIRDNHIEDKLHLNSIVNDSISSDTVMLNDELADFVTKYYHVSV